MLADRKSIIRCAIYTRKSSEEGLEQSFNSLEAQCEACQAYIASQKHEHWRAISTRYDDGGYSGGSMDRPALHQLLADIDAGKIDTVVVYKVGRLTRSLADFAKIIERFDARQVSFVSVTQQFNTTTSMGRLTLNVLLSFAQFEREVTGERIRDKIAASKRKGIWMGGTLPAGYDLRDRKLVVNAQEAIRVRRIFELYVELGCVANLKERLDREGVKSKMRTSGSGQKSGGKAYSRGALYCLLQNPIYVGKIRHRDAVYEGAHEAIISQPLWDKAQERLKANSKERRTASNAKSPSLLVGLLYDSEGNRFTPFHADRRGKRYRYYVSQAKIHARASATPGPTRLPAADIEEVISGRIHSLLMSSEELLRATGARLSAAGKCGWLFQAEQTPRCRTDAMLYQFRIANGLDAKGFNNLFVSRSDLFRQPLLPDGDPQKLGKDDVVVLLDDFSGTGQQVSDAWNDPVTSFGALLAGVGNVHLILVAATKAARLKISSETTIRLLSAHELRETDNVFSVDCKHFTNAEQAKLLRYCKIASKRKPKGFGSCGLLVVFQHRTPNNSIPILHIDNSKWTGLFPRHH